jgi:hypothetical protein
MMVISAPEFVPGGLEQVTARELGERDVGESAAEDDVGGAVPVGRILRALCRGTCFLEADFDPKHQELVAGLNAAEAASIINSVKPQLSELFNRVQVLCVDAACLRYCHVMTSWLYETSQTSIAYRHTSVFRMYLTEAVPLLYSSD